VDSAAPDGAIAVGRPTVLIISDDAEFSRALSARWHAEKKPPAFVMNDARASFDLAIVGKADAAVFDALRVSGKPVIHVSNSNGHAHSFPGVISIDQIAGWLDLVISVAQELLENSGAASELATLSELTSRLEREASLGRYILEMRHSLNNALTSILGNSELMLMETESLSPALRTQVETIRNMGMRMNEILQRFSSLQKEMQLTDQQVWKKAAKAGAGA
jgi:signal transduction histidine kinase